MIRLDPIPEAHHLCPDCGIALTAKGWYVPGMRVLADLQCGKCAKEFFGDLPVGHGMRYPMLLEKKSGIVHSLLGEHWFADWLGESYQKRSNKPLDFRVEEYRPIRKAVLLNCLDRIYGHSLLKLLNAQHYINGASGSIDHTPELGLIVLVPSSLRWLVPDGAAEVWTVGAERATGAARRGTGSTPLDGETEWSDWLAGQIKERIKRLDECHVSVAFPHPHPDDYDIERFSRIKPFPLNEWEKRLATPTVTYIWRKDISRAWGSESSKRSGKIIRGGVNAMLNIIDIAPIEKRREIALITNLAENLKNIIPNLDFAVAGMGKAGKLPDEIKDLRIQDGDDGECSMNSDKEKALCKRYAESHVVIGMHGSNMLLPSAHAGSVVDLMPDTKWPNITQDILLRKSGQRETLFRYRMIPASTEVELISKIVTTLMSGDDQMELNMNREFTDHNTHKDFRGQQDRVRAFLAKPRSWYK